MTESKTKTKLANYYYAYGRRKTAIATVRLFKGTEHNQVNDMDLKQYFPLSSDQKVALEPLYTVEKAKDMYFTSMVKGGGKKAQRGAISLAIAKALVKMDPALKDPLKKKSLMTRDDRMVERKKTGRVKARKSPQYSKR